MRAVLLVAIFGTLAVLAAWFIARSFVRRRGNQRRIEELEAENAQLDELLEKQRGKSGFRPK